MFRVHQLWKDLVPKVSETYAYANPSSELTFQSIPPPPQGDGSHPNSMGFDADSEPEKELISLQVLFFFDDAAATEGLYNALKSFIRIFNDFAEQEGLRHNYVYLNYAGYFQDPLAGYGAEKVDELKAVSQKYDPEGLFQTQLVGGFKLFS